MRKVIGLALLGALALGFSGCESKEKVLAEKLKQERIHCGNIQFPLAGFIKDEHFQYYEAIYAMKGSQYKALLKEMGCNPEIYSVDTQLKEAQEKLAEIEKRDIEAQSDSMDMFKESRKKSIEYTKGLIKILESKK